MTPTHQVETFRVDGSDEWGWQCFEPSCREQARGMNGWYLADVAAAEHRAASRVPKKGADSDD